MNGSDEILASVFRSSLDCIIIIDEAGCAVEFNPAAEATFGYARADVLGRRIGDLIVPAHLRAAHSEGFARYLRGGEPRVLGRRIEVEAMRADGTLFPVELAITEVRVGPRRLFTACLRDLSDSREVATALRESEARLAAFLENAPVAMYLKDLQGRYVVANRYMTEVLGRSIEQIVGREYAEVLGAASTNDVKTTDKALLETGQPQIGEAEFMTAGGVRQTMAVRFPIRDAAGRISHLGGVILDISDQKRAEKLLRESERRFRALTEFHPVPVTVTRFATGEALVANPAFHAMIGKPYREGERLHGRDFFDDAEGRRAFEAVAAHQQFDNFETMMVRADGTRFPVAVTWRWIKFEGEDAVVASFIDLTESRAAEAELARSREALHQSEKMTALGSLLAGVSHELNNPLAVVVGEAIILEEDAEGTPFAAPAGRIRRAAERCSRIVQTFLAMARQKKPERTAVDASELVTAALELTSYGLRTAGVRVTREIGAGLQPIWGDSDQLHQVVVNLIVNAQQAMQDNAGPRTLRIRTVRGSTPGMVAIEFADSGPGVPEEIAGRIFDPFFTTKPQGAGTGVGLSFCQGIAQAHGGTLRLVGSGPGATFRLELPAASAPAIGRAPEGAPAKPEPTTVGRALVVDDEEDLAETLARFLNREGYAVDVATGGAEAIERLRAGDYDVILSDLRMPGLDGPQLFAWIEAERPHLRDRIAFVTGDTLGPSAVRFLDRAGRPVTEKPFSRESLRRLLDQLEGQPQPVV